MRAITPLDVRFAGQDRAALPARCPVCGATGEASPILDVPALSEPHTALVLLRCAQCASAFYDPPGIRDFSDLGAALPDALRPQHLPHALDRLAETARAERCRQVLAGDVVVPGDQFQQRRQDVAGGGAGKFQLCQRFHAAFGQRRMVDQRHDDGRLARRRLRDPAGLEQP